MARKKKTPKVSGHAFTGRAAAEGLARSARKQRRKAASAKAKVYNVYQLGPGAPEPRALGPSKETQEIAVMPRKKTKTTKKRAAKKRAAKKRTTKRAPKKQAPKKRTAKKRAAKKRAAKKRVRMSAESVHASGISAMRKRSKTSTKKTKGAGSKRYSTKLQVGRRKGRVSCPKGSSLVMTEVVQKDNKGHKHVMIMGRCVRTRA